ncbi:hypothetical protein [Nocardia sp. NPDC004260]
MTSPEQVLAGYQTAVAAVRARVLQLCIQAWDTLGSYRDAEISRLVSFIVPQVQAGQLQVANLTAAYLTSIMTAQGEQAEPVTVDRDEILSARGVPAGEVYRRPAVQLYSTLSEGQNIAAAVAVGRQRLQSLIATDMQMAKVRQSRASLANSDAQYYQRVLKGAGNCAKCVITSTRRYRKEVLLPIHPGCDCGVKPLPKGEHPPVLDPQLLEATHEQVGQFAGIENRSAIDYQNLIATHEHGEIGPVLTWRHQSFTGPDDI